MEQYTKGQRVTEQIRIYARHVYRGESVSKERFLMAIPANVEGEDFEVVKSLLLATPIPQSSERVGKSFVGWVNFEKDGRIWSKPYYVGDSFTDIFGEHGEGWTVMPGREWLLGNSERPGFPATIIEKVDSFVFGGKNMDGWFLSRLTLVSEPAAPSPLAAEPANELALAKKLIEDFLNKLLIVEEQSDYVWACAQIYLGPYKGERCADEVEALRKFVWPNWGSAFIPGTEPPARTELANGKLRTAALDYQERISTLESELAEARRAIIKDIFGESDSQLADRSTPATERKTNA